MTEMFLTRYSVFEHVELIYVYLFYNFYMNTPCIGHDTLFMFIYLMYRESLSPQTWPLELVIG